MNPLKREREDSRITKRNAACRTERGCFRTLGAGDREIKKEWRRRAGGKEPKGSCSKKEGSTLVILGELLKT